MSLNVLIVDDSFVMRSMVKRVLNICDLQIQNIFEAGNGKEGLEIIENNWVDLVLADINMPVMSGDEMIDKIRENPDMANMAIIVISSESSTRTIEILQQKGALFIHKPFTPENLQAAVFELLGDTNE
ncbi:MAG TPA: response regulator [bacterium]|nr:response regulator [bacterium]HPN43206.1 response regulator [bacterium]